MTALRREARPRAGRPAAGRRSPGLALGILTCLLLGGLSCTWVRPAEREGGTLVLAVPAELPELDPHRAAAAHPLFEAVYDTLLTRTPDLSLAPGLAVSWLVLDGGLRVTLDLRRGVTFHDGTPLDGTAVAKNIERVMGGSPDQFPVQALLGPVREVSATEFQVTLVYDRPFPPVWQALTDPRLGIVSPDALIAPSGQEQPVPGPLGMPGSGPYKVAARDGSGVVLERNPLYRWPPGSARNRGRAYPEGLRVLALGPDWAGESGESPAGGEGEETWDLLWWPAGSFLPSRVDERTAGWRRFAYGGERLTYVSLDATSGPLADPVVRQAALAAVDRPGLLAVAPWPSRPAVCLLPTVQGGPAGTPGGPDLAAADRLLDSLGWVRGEDGLRRKGGQLLEIRLATYETDPGFQALATRICSDLFRAGFSCRTVAARRRLEPGLIPSGPNAWLLYYQWPDPDVLFYLFHSSQIGLANRTGYANDAVDALLQAARTEMETDIRTGLYLEAQILILGDGVVLPLFESQGEVRASPRIAGFRPWTDGRLPLHDIYLKQTP